MYWSKSSCLVLGIVRMWSANSYQIRIKHCPGPAGTHEALCLFQLEQPQRELDIFGACNCVSIHVMADLANSNYALPKRIIISFLPIRHMNIPAMPTQHLPNEPLVQYPYREGYNEYSVILHWYGHWSTGAHGSSYVTYVQSIIPIHEHKRNAPPTESLHVLPL